MSLGRDHQRHFRGYPLGIMENEMEAAIQGLGFRVLAAKFCFQSMQNMFALWAVLFGIEVPSFERCRG